MKFDYGFDKDVKISPPVEKFHPSVLPELEATLRVAKHGWEIIPEGEQIPQKHQHYLAGSGWTGPKRCHSTMTPFKAMVYGNVLAYARPISPDTTNQNNKTQ